MIARLHTEANGNVNTNEATFSYKNKPAIFLL